MGLVKYALNFRITFFVLSALILFLGAGAVVTMPKDVFPSVDIPVVSIIWTYTGLDVKEMEERVTTYSEYAVSNNVPRPNSLVYHERRVLSGIPVLEAQKELHTGRIHCADVVNGRLHLERLDEAIEVEAGKWIPPWGGEVYLQFCHVSL